MERKQVIRIIQWAFSTYGPVQSAIILYVESLPQKSQGIIQGRIIEKLDWSRMQEEYYYSERQMRNIMNSALDDLGNLISEFMYICGSPSPHRMTERQAKYG